MSRASLRAIAFGKALHAELGYPENPEEFAARAGVRIILGSENYATDGPPSFISQTPDTYAPRQRFTIMHEMAHIAIQRSGLEDDILAEVDPEDAELHLELVANYLGGVFLLPDPMIQRIVDEYGFTPDGVLRLRAAARASLAATIRRMVGWQEEVPRTIILGGQSYILDVASSNPWNRLRRHERLPDMRAAFPEADLLTLPTARGYTLGIIEHD